MNEKAIVIEHLMKIYNLYDKPSDRFKEAVGLKHRSYHKEFKALNDVSFEVDKGETVGIIGTNGAGKSTLLKIITGVLTPTDGVVQINGKVSALLELGAGFNQEYTGYENIFLNGRMMGYTRKEMSERVEKIVEFADIGEFINQPVKMYSSGMFARLAFAVAINVEPDILIVDEALSVGDLFFQNKCFKKFDELRRNGVTILFVSHDISSVRQMCSRVLWLENGQEKIFDSSNLVCDMYMDSKRKNMNELYKPESGINSYLNGEYVGDAVRFPIVKWRNSSLLSDDVSIRSVFITNDNGEIVNKMEVEREYTFHVVVIPKVDIDNMIVGVVVENNKGLPIYDINNYISTEKVILGTEGQIIETLFSFKLPRIMKGIYLVSAAVAKGSQRQNVMLTWLHGVLELEIINNGYNSSYIEIPAQIKHNLLETDKVEFYEEENCEN